MSATHAKKRSGYAWCDSRISEEHLVQIFKKCCVTRSELSSYQLKVCHRSFHNIYWTNVQWKEIWLTDHAVGLVHVGHLLCQQQQLLLGTLGEGEAERDFELLQHESQKSWKEGFLNLPQGPFCRLGILRWGRCSNPRQSGESMFYQV